MDTRTSTAVSGRTLKRELSRAVGAHIKDFVGRGPKAASAFIHDPLVVITFEDLLTPGEQALANVDAVEAVRNMRRSFSDAMSADLIAIVEGLLGRSVVTMFADYAVVPDYAFAGFLLDGSLGEDDRETREAVDEEASFGRRDDPAELQQREISGRMVALYKEFVGRGPTRARTHIDHEIVFTVLGGALTKAEQSLAARSLAEGGRGDNVREMRRQLQSAMLDDAIGIVEEVTGARVTAFMSDHSIEPDYGIEVFLLDRSEVRTDISG